MTPFEDRYKNRVSEIREIFGEENYLRIMFDIEVAWWYAINNPKAGIAEFAIFFNEVKHKFSYKRIKEHECETNHDVVALVRFLKEDCGMTNAHYGLTSQDVVSLAYSISAYKASKFIGTKLGSLCDDLKTFYGSVDRMVGYTHGQKATPISTQNLLDVIINEDKIGISSMRDRLKIRPETRFGNGACGDRYSIKNVENEWEFEKNVKRCLTMVSCAHDISGLNRSTYSRQTDYYPYIASLSETIKLLSLLLKRESVNIWLLASKGIVVKINTAQEAGSSAMPQKVNPIEFENAEGNAELCEAMANVMINKAMSSRLDRDLSDLTVMRNLGSMFGYLTLAITSMSRGLKRYSLDADLIEETISNSHEMLAESVSLMMQKNGVAGAYDIAKGMFMSKKDMSREDFEDCVMGSEEIPEELKQELLKLEL